MLTVSRWAGTIEVDGLSEYDRRRPPVASDGHDLRPLYLARLAAYGTWERDENAFDRDTDDVDFIEFPGLDHGGFTTQAMENPVVPTVAEWITRRMDATW